MLLNLMYQSLNSENTNDIGKAIFKTDTSSLLFKSYFIKHQKLDMRSLMRNLTPVKGKKIKQLYLIYQLIPFDCKGDR